MQRWGKRPLIGSPDEVSRVAQPDTKTKAVKHEAQGCELRSRGSTPHRSLFWYLAGGPQDGGCTTEATSAKNKPGCLLLPSWRRQPLHRAYIVWPSLSSCQNPCQCSFLGDQLNLVHRRERLTVGSVWGQLLCWWLLLKNEKTKDLRGGGGGKSLQCVYWRRHNKKRLLAQVKQMILPTETAWKAIHDYLGESKHQLREGGWLLSWFYR